MFHFRSSLVLVVIIFFNVALLTYQSDPPLPRPRNLVTKLTHYHSFDSPFYDGSISASKASLIDLENSIARAAHLTTPQNTGTDTFLLHPNGDIEAAVWARPFPGGFLAHIQVGSTLLKQLVFMDTGSGLLWINCWPCSGYINVLAPIFAPKDSSTFHKEACTSGFCDKTGTVEVECDDNYANRTCAFTVRYARTGNTKGYLARDSIKFGKTEDILPEIAFGCTNSTQVRQTNGVLGLSASPISLPSQMQAQQFAYCLGNISDKDYPHNTLIIGQYISLTGSRTPIIVEDKFYLTLEGIKFGDKALDFDAGILKRTGYSGGMVLDTGSTYTFLPRVVVHKIEAEIINVIGTSLPLNHNHIYAEKYFKLLCYDGVLFTEDIDWFPYVTFQFQGDAPLELSYQNMFRQMDEKTFCSVVLPSELLGEGTTISILGNMMQQYYFFTCDISQKLLAFERMGCEELDDGY